MNSKAGDTYTIKKSVTKEMVSHYANVSGDYNSIHLNKDAAVAAGFPSEIAHGMLTMGMSTKLFRPFLEEGYSVISHTTRFKGPLLVEGELVLECKVEKLDEATIELKITGSTNGQVVILGSAELNRSLYESNN